MTTSHLICTFLWKKMFGRKKAFVITKFRTLRAFERIIKSWNYLPLVSLSLKSWLSEAAVHRCFSKEMFLKISQYSQENTCANPCRPSFTEHLRWLLLGFCVSKYFFQLNLLLTVTLVFAPNSFGNTHWNSSVKKVFIDILQVSQEKNCVEVSF